MSETDCADGTELSTVGEDTHQMAARIAQKFRDAGLGCEIFNFMPADAAVLRRDRVAVVLALALLTALAWSYLLWLSADMSVGGMDMGDFRMIPSGMGLMVPAQVPWQAMEFAFVFVMWTVMMVGMMTPSAAPMILMYARVGRQTEAPGRPLAATVWFTAGYFLVWIGFALLATVLQWAFERAALLDSWMGAVRCQSRVAPRAFAHAASMLAIAYGKPDFHFLSAFFQSPRGRVHAPITTCLAEPNPLRPTRSRRSKRRLRHNRGLSRHARPSRYRRTHYDRACDNSAIFL